MFDIDNIDKPVDLAGGEWVGDIPDHPGVSFKVRSSGYKPFRQGVERLMRSFGKRASQAMSTPEYQSGIGQLLADHILLDWKDAVKKAGEPVKYSKALATQILTATDDRGMGRTFRDAVAHAAGIVADRHLGLAEDVSGN